MHFGWYWYPKCNLVSEKADKSVLLSYHRHAIVISSLLRSDRASWHGKGMFWKRRQYIQWRVIIGEASDAIAAANDNCFWMFILGPADPLEGAAKTFRRRQQFIDSTELFIEDRLRLIEACDVFLDLYRAVCVDHNEEAAMGLAPILNRHVPELMRRCPYAELRLTEQQLDDVRAWYYVVEDDRYEVD